MSNDIDPSQEAAELAEINKLPLGKRLGYYTKKSGPGWLQAAITLGGGSLASALFLGVILEYNLMWLQPLAMIFGVIMLSAIAYVTLSSGKRPFGAINKHVSPVLGWAWLIAAMMANIVWCLPQFALGTGAVQQNLIPSLESVTWAPWAIGAALLIVCALIVKAYDRDSAGVKLFEIILKVLVGIVVVSFFLVVAKLTMAGTLEWGAIFKGLIPNFSFLSQPAPAIQAAIDATDPTAAETWKTQISGIQTDKIIAAFGTAVGINMTFLLPYSMLKKGWGKPHRGLATFDLSTGLIIPFIIATSCIVIAAGSQFHGKFDDSLNPDGTVIAGKESGFNKVADSFVKANFATEFTAIKEAADLETKNGKAEFEATTEAKVAELRDGLSLENKKLAAM
ncbi:divalent metal cation transporter, partial [bacterium]|nr:divalent metal cation transporter [bacterium]